jgi:hypothetical protein
LTRPRCRRNSPPIRPGKPSILLYGPFLPHCPPLLCADLFAILGQLSQVKGTSKSTETKLNSFRVNVTDKVDDVRKDTGQKFTSAVKVLDKGVQKGAAKSKNRLSGFFGRK